MPSCFSVIESPFTKTEENKEMEILGDSYLALQRSSSYWRKTIGFHCLTAKLWLSLVTDRPTYHKSRQIKSILWASLSFPLFVVHKHGGQLGMHKNVQMLCVRALISEMCWLVCVWFISVYACVCLVSKCVHVRDGVGVKKGMNVLTYTRIQIMYFWNFLVNCKLL